MILYQIVGRFYFNLSSGCYNNSMIVGIGIDMVKIDRIKRILDSKRGDRFRKRVFCPSEAEYASRKRRPYEHFAGFFAVKEAFMKACGEGWRKGLKFSEIQVLHDDSGAPRLRLAGKSKEYSEKLNANKVHISISHDTDYAVGIVIIEG